MQLGVAGAEVTQIPGIASPPGSRRLNNTQHPRHQQQAKHILLSNKNFSVKIVVDLYQLIFLIN
jgi:hypothetical protein